MRTLSNEAHILSKPNVLQTIHDQSYMPARITSPCIDQWSNHNFEIDMSTMFDSPLNISYAVATSIAVPTPSILPPPPTTIALPTISPASTPSPPSEDCNDAGPSQPQSPSKTESVSDSGSDDDTSVYGESDDDDSDDDEYVPAGNGSPKRKRSPRPTKLALRYPSSSPPPAFNLIDEDFPSPPKRFRRAAPPRSTQVAPTLGQTDVPSPSALKGANRWACPHCDFVQKNHRMPDLKRHIRKHYPAKYVCCGVPVEEKDVYGAKETGPPMEYNGRMMVGGCMQSMSRRDALKRHIDNKNVSCVGDLDGDWHHPL